jgi:hypothetical protein
LELVQDVLPIDIRHLAVTGCSYAGKMAIFAGAFDERIALTIGQESGGGGYTTWRYSEVINKIESVETLGKTDYNWFRDAMKDFSSQVTKLPEDHHELMAMVAPRALIVTGNPGWVWLADESGHVGSKAAKEVWNALGIPDRFGYSLVGGHNHCAVPESQIPEIEAFVEKFLLGNNAVNTNVATTPYTTDLSPWITWTTPALSNDTSFFGWASLVYPSNLQKGLDKEITFKWSKVQGAEKYFIQLSTNQTFTDIVKSDSTTDTNKTITGLLDGKRYFWRVQVKNNVGSLGPFSDVWNFSTFIPLPAAPQLVSAAPYPDQPGFVTFTWNKAKDADQYFIQLSHVESFASIFKTDSTTSDTVKVLSGLSEGRKEYWRVRASNVTGSSPWNESNFTILYAPTDLGLHNSALNEITLTWTDHSTVEEGYVIERKQSPQTSFTVLDTLKGSGNEYADINVEQNQTYTYRIKAYKDSAVSEYSNEATLSATDVQEETRIPKEYSISQNYPNPFNPTTKLQFALPQSSLTKLIIYDILGREVATLVNEEKPAGIYTINFSAEGGSASGGDAGNLPSGVYFYRIQSGDFIQTKKMILMK